MKQTRDQDLAFPMRSMVQIVHSAGGQTVDVAREGRHQRLGIPAGTTRSGVNGGELLFLALATCYCNELYHEAVAGGVTLRRVEVEGTDEFHGAGSL